MKNKWYIPIIIFAVLVLMYFIRGFFDDQVELETALEGSMEEMTTAKGLLIKYESVYETGSNGTVEAKVASGSKVSKGALLANVYSGTADAEVMARLESVDKKIDAIKASQEEGLSFTSDVTKLDSEIADKVSAIIENGQKKEMSKIAELKTSLSTLVERKAVVSGQNSAGNATLSELEQTRQSLLERVGTVQKELRADQAGIFISATDGLEQLITPYNMDNLTPSALTELENTEQKNVENNGKNGVYACKIVDNFRYFVAMNIPAEQAGQLKKGDEVSLRFGELSTEIIGAQIYAVSGEEDGQVTVICESGKYLDSLLDKRAVNVDFIKKRYEGFRVSVSAIHTVDGVMGVYVKRGGLMRFIPIEVLYNTQDTAIVTPVESSDIKLKVYDEIIVRASSYEDGALVK